MARTLKTKIELKDAINCSIQYKRTPDEIIYRYTVAHTDAMCAELGLRPIKGENEEDKAKRLHEKLKTLY